MYFYKYVFYYYIEVMELFNNKNCRREFKEVLNKQISVRRQFNCCTIVKLCVRHGPRKARMQTNKIVNPLRPLCIHRHRIPPQLHVFF